MKQWCDARSGGEASSQQLCAYEDLLLLAAVVMLAATHQAHSYLLGFAAVCRHLIKYLFCYFRTYGIHKNLPGIYVTILLTIFGPINYAPP